MEREIAGQKPQRQEKDSNVEWVLYDAKAVRLD
jgi:hypothetical protein